MADPEAQGAGVDSTTDAAQSYRELAQDSHPSQEKINRDEAVGYAIDGAETARADLRRQASAELDAAAQSKDLDSQSESIKAATRKLDSAEGYRRNSDMSAKAAEALFDEQAAIRDRLENQ